MAPMMAPMNPAGIIVPNMPQANSQLKLRILQKCILQRVVKSFKQEVMGWPIHRGKRMYAICNQQMLATISTHTARRYAGRASGGYGP